MKSYTDLEQSKKLAEILPIESADMCYIQDLLAGGKYGDYKPYIGNLIPAYGQDKIRCWSLTALLGVLPNNKHITTTLSRGGWKIEPVEYIDKWFCEYEDKIDEDSPCREIAVSAENPVDACVVMVKKLHELNML